MAFGPMQVVTIGLPQAVLPPELINHLRRLREAGLVRLVDAVWIAKDEQGEFSELPVPGPSGDDAILQGTLSGALFGCGRSGDEWIATWSLLGTFADESGEFGLSSDNILEIADLIPQGSSTAVLLLEHLWAVGVREAVSTAGGRVIAQGWFTPSTLIAIQKATSDESSPEIR